MSKSLHCSLLRWTLDLRWFGFYMDLSIDFTVVHEIFSFSKHIEGTGIKEVALFSVLKSVKGPRCSKPQPRHPRYILRRTVCIYCSYCKSVHTDSVSIPWALFQSFFCLVISVLYVMYFFSILEAWQSTGTLHGF